jgi:hypothetical protein
MSSGGGSFGTAGLHVGSDWQVRCSACPDGLPILSAGAGDSGFMITLAGRSVPVEFAPELAAQAARFAAECERIHAASSGSAADSTARQEAAGETAA